MRERLTAAGLALALVTLQTSGFRGWLMLLPRADVLLLFVLARGMRRGESSGALWGVTLGFLSETFSAGLPGATILTMGLLGFASGSLRERLDCENPNTQAIVAVVATLAQGIVHLALLEVFSKGRGVLSPLLGTVVPAAIAGGALLPAAVYARRWLSRHRAQRLATAAGVSG